MMFLGIEKKDALCNPMTFGTDADHKICGIFLPPLLRLLSGSNQVVPV